MPKEYKTGDLVWVIYYKPYQVGAVYFNIEVPARAKIVEIITTERIKKSERRCEVKGTKGKWSSGHLRDDELFETKKECFNNCKNVDPKAVLIKELKSALKDEEKHVHDRKRRVKMYKDELKIARKLKRVCNRHFDMRYAW